MRLKIIRAPGETFESWLVRWRERKKARHGGPPRILKDGKVFRMRRGKLVEIPPKWVGQVTTRQTIRQRESKQPKRPPSRQTKRDELFTKEDLNETEP